ncbi:MAG: HAD-IA family hydrolase [Phyllobacteriaceae bacterium]|nr:HAD-IA family hydrolase [Phyllobacteriaceae bacterium]
MADFDLMIFDCDGVLVDSEVLAARIDAELITKAGYPITPEEMSDRYSGLTFKQILIEIERISDVPMSASMLTRADALIDKALERVKIIEGAREAALHFGDRKCICSNSTSSRLKVSLGATGLRPIFGDAVFSALEVAEKRGKPAPDVFLHAAAQFKANPARCFVIEDSVHGIHGARAAGMRVIGFTGASHSTPGHAERLSEAGAETVINRLRDLPETVEALTLWSADV